MAESRGQIADGGGRASFFLDFMEFPRSLLGFSKLFRTRKISPTLILFVAILLLAAYLRFGAINLAEFKSDEAGQSSVVRDLVERGRVPLLGPALTSGGSAGPLYYYILAIPFFISTNPVVASIFVALLNIVGLILTFKLAREFFNERVALIATALDAVSPFAILFSRKIWNPDLIFPFSVILLYCLFAFVVKNRQRYLIPIFVCSSIIFQIHPITIFLAPAIILFLWKYHSRIRLGYLLVGMALSLILFSPFIYGEATSSLRETTTFAATLGDFGASVNPIVVQQISSVTSGSGFDYILGAGARPFYASIFNVNDYFVVENLCLYLGFALVLVWAARDPFGKNLRYSILFSWISIPMMILLFFNPTLGLWPHHVVMFFPANFLLVAIFFDYAMTRKPFLRPDGKHRDWSRITRKFSILILIALLLAQTIFGFGFLRLLSTQGGTSGDYEVGVEYKIDVAKFIAQNSNGSNFTISNTLTPGEIGTEYTYLLNLYVRAQSGSVNTNYIVMNNLSKPDPSLLQQLSRYPKVNFGPLTLYIVRD